MDDITYWKNLASMAYRRLIEQNNGIAAAVIKNGTIDIWLDSHDNWNGGIDYWTIVFILKYDDYIAIENQRPQIEEELTSILSSFHSDERDIITSVAIKLNIERYVDWNAALPDTKEDTIRLIEHERELLEDIATMKRSFMEDGLEESFRKRHRRICDIAQKAGFDYPIDCNSLREWWQRVKGFGAYTERRARIAQLFQPIIDMLNASEDNAAVDFPKVSLQSNTVKQAIADAELFIRERKYESAVDRIHTAFHGYLRQILDRRQIEYQSDDSLPSLYAKLHSHYRTAIQPPDVADKIKDIIRSGGSMVTKVNELRNKNTVAHANTQLIQKREAELVIRMLNALWDYIEDIEKDFQVMGTKSAEGD